MITRETDYAIRAILGLSQSHGGGGVVPASALAESMGIPYRFLRTLSRKLVTAQLVVSKRGNGGGLALARAPHAISLLDVMRAVAPASMILNRCLQTPEACSRSGHCPVHHHLGRLQGKLETMLDELHFDQF
jgi:Rrf2 family protein